MSGRFRYLAPLGHSVAPANVGGRTVCRLRASGPGANVCRRLRIAGEDCSVVNQSGSKWYFDPGAKPLTCWLSC